MRWDATISRHSEESPGATGLKVFDETVGRFGDGVTVPQMGWNRVEPGPGSRFVEAGWAYFANSYRIDRLPEGWAGSNTDHGGKFVSAPEKGDVLACQFHPELSGEWRAASSTAGSESGDGSMTLASRVIPCLSKTATEPSNRRRGRPRIASALLDRSRIPDLEHALSDEMIPQQQAIVRDQVRREFDETAGVTLSVLSARQRNLVEQTFELNGLRGKNMQRRRSDVATDPGERTDFEKSLRQLQALRTVFTRHSQGIFANVGLDSLKRHVRDARDLMKASNLTTQLRDGMSSLIDTVRTDFTEADKLVREVTTMMVAMYQRFSLEHGLTLGRRCSSRPAGSSPRSTGSNSSISASSAWSRC